VATGKQNSKGLKGICSANEPPVKSNEQGSDMKVILFGASEMVGQGVLRECLRDREVESVLAVSRSPLSQKHEKLREIARQNVADLNPVEDRLRVFDACIFCLGVSSAGMEETDYRRVTYDLTLAVARTLARLNPEMTFI
jgi:putative NADH-flavin reductase